MDKTTSFLFRVAAAWLALSAGFLPVRAQDAVALRAANAPAHAIWVDSLDLTKMVQRRRTPRAGRSLNNHPITLHGVVYPHGIGTLSINEFVIDLKGQATRFVSMAGIDDEVPAGFGSVNFEVWVDNRKMAGPGLLRSGDEPKFISVDLTGAHYLELFIDDGGDTSNDDNADWAGAMIVMAPDATVKPEPLVRPVEPRPPIASSSAAAPSIHGPRITGARPRMPFLYLIPATGEGPLTFSARNLPRGLTLDPKTGIIHGALQSAGKTVVQLRVSGAKGSSRRDLTIAGGDTALALTPPMGWNSWNAWSTAVDDAKTRAAADSMVSSGLAAHGFQYISIDDTWEGKRNAQGEIQPNEKFPDMKALTEYLHGKGLKAGIYSGPGPTTCEGFPGSYRYEAQDAASYARWGFDLLKYDWCSYSSIAKDESLPELQKPYQLMSNLLRSQPRDIVFSLCQYGMGTVWEWGESAGGQMWRTSGDLVDVWSNMASVGFRQAGREKYSGPGHWTDPDMLVVGKVAIGGGTPHDSRLTPNEQVTHISLWSLQAAPLLIGCDLAHMDQFTKDLLTNDEVLDIDQDPLGRAAARVSRNERLEVWARPLADGTKAVGLFNRGLTSASITASWEDLGLTGSQPVRDVWLHKDLAPANGAFTATVPSHGTVLVRIGRPR